MPRGRLQSQLGRRRKVIFIWLLLLSFSGYVAWSKSCQEGECLADFFSSAYLRLGLALAAAGLLLFLLRRRIFGEEQVDLCEFAMSPEKFNHRTIEAYGRVRRVLKDTFSEQVKRKVVDMWRSATNNPETSGRYIHQRLIVDSPALKPGEPLAIHHNVKFGRLNVRPGDWLKFKGEYIHEPIWVIGLLWTRRSSYGVVHSTHEPNGFIERLGTAPSENAASQIGT